MEKKPYLRIRKLELEEGRIYTFDLLIFQVGMLFLILILFYFALEQGFDLRNNFYISCPEKAIMPCENPLYENFAYCGKAIPSDDPICKEEFLRPGFSYGKKSGTLFESFGMITLFIVVVCFLINHFAYNKGFFDNWKGDIE